jgi:hypothetical protein
LHQLRRKISGEDSKSHLAQNDKNRHLRPGLLNPECSFIPALEIASAQLGKKKREKPPMNALDYLFLKNILKP